MDQEATLGLKHLSEEAEALLLRYLKEFHADPKHDARQIIYLAESCFFSEYNRYGGLISFH